jgi:hypothetical protein
MKTLLLTTLLFAVSFSLHAEDIRRDGNWWLEQTHVFRSAYMLGFFDGTNLGHEFSFWIDKYEPACLAKKHESYDRHFYKYMKNVTRTQLVDGVDVFYKDDRNRKLDLASAVWFTVNVIAGTPQADLNKMVESLRKNAN